MEFWVEGLFRELTLTSKSGRIVPAHKNVLAAVSCYFQGLFRSDMKEVHENSVDFSMVDETVVNELLRFIYSGETSINFHNIRNLLKATDYLTIRPFALKGYGSIAHSASPHGLLTRSPRGRRV